MRVEQGQLARAAVAGSLLSTLATSAVCILPLLAILVGVSGLGFLARYAWIRDATTMLTVALLALGFWFAHRDPSHRGRISAWAALFVATAVNIVEYVVLPTLA